VSCSVHDGVQFERRGVPVAVVVTDGFLAAGRAQAQMLGLPELALVAIAHPLSTLRPDEINGRAAQAFPLAEAVLLGTGTEMADAKEQPR
jgi:hypothetical protein